MEMGEDLVKAGNPGYVGLMAWVVHLSSDTCTQVRTHNVLWLPFFFFLFCQGCGRRRMDYIPPSPPPRRHCLLTYCCLQEGGGGGAKKRNSFFICQTGGCALRILLFCWERWEILGVGRCRLTSRAEKGINFPERTFGKNVVAFMQLSEFLFGSGSRFLRLQNLPKRGAILGGEKKRERRINLAKRH